MHLHKVIAIGDFSEPFSEPMTPREKYSSVDEENINME